MTSLDGDVYVDFLGEYTAGIYGHSNEKIAAAVSEAMSKGWNFGGPNVFERELAKKVAILLMPFRHGFHTLSAITTFLTAVWS